jgi:uncharacterized protein YbbK (DUF523 family)
MIQVLISACLIGEPVRYDGTDNKIDNSLLQTWHNDGRLVPFCPEVAGGLPVPRPAAEIQGEDGGEGVLNGDVRIETEDGVDVTDHFLRGAKLTLRQAERADVDLAVLKDGSPSCGSTYIYDGSFSGTEQTDRGVTAALLRENDIPVFNENSLQEAQEYMASLSGK